MRQIGAIGWLLTYSSLLSMPVAAETVVADRVLKLELEAPPGCPGQRAILDAVVKLVRTAAEMPLEASAVIAEQDGRFHADLSMLGGQRRLDGATCRAVSEALVVILALTIDPEASTNTSAFEFEEPTPPKPAAETPPRPPAQDDATQATPAAPPIVRERPVDDVRTRGEASAPQDFRFGGSAFVLGELGILPGPAIGAFGLARVGRRGWRVELGGGLLLPHEQRLASNPNAGGELGWASGQLNACILPSPPFMLCLGGELGRVFGEGFGVDNERLGGATWSAGVASWSARFRLAEHVAFEARLALAVPAVRPTFDIDGQFLHRPAPISGRFLAGIAFR